MLSFKGGIRQEEGKGIPSREKKKTHAKTEARKTWHVWRTINR